MDPCITGHWSWKGCQNWSFIHIRNGRPYFCGARADPALLGLPSLGAVGQSVVARSAFLSGRHHASCQWSAKNVVPNYLNWEYGPVRQRRSCQRWKGTVPASERRTACVWGGGCEREKEGPVTRHRATQALAGSSPLAAPPPERSGQPPAEALGGTALDIRALAGARKRWSERERGSGTRHSERRPQLTNSNSEAPRGCEYGPAFAPQLRPRLSPGASRSKPR